MRIAKRIAVLAVCLPFAVVLIVAASLVSVSLAALYFIVAVAYPMEAEWSV